MFLFPETEAKALFGFVSTHPWDGNNLLQNKTSIVLVEGVYTQNLCSRLSELKTEYDKKILAALAVEGKCCKVKVFGVPVCRLKLAYFLFWFEAVI